MDFWQYVGTRHQQLLTDACRHVALVLPCVLVAAVLGVLVAIATHRRGWTRNWPRERSTTLACHLPAVPPLALLGLLVPLVGMGLAPTVIALTLYGLLPVVRHTVVGLRGIDPALVDAARGIGMSRSARLLRVELPIAWPPILTGIRVSTRTLMGVAAVAAFVSAPGLGNEIFRGIASPGGENALNAVLAGTLGIIAIGLLFDAGYVLIGRLTVPGRIGTRAALPEGPA